jgi:hypothetical protein
MISAIKMFSNQLICTNTPMPIKFYGNQLGPRNLTGLGIFWTALVHTPSGQPWQSPMSTFTIRSVLTVTNEYIHYQTRPDSLQWLPSLSDPPWQSPMSIFTIRQALTVPN